MGRPKTLGAKVLVALPIPELAALDSWRSSHPENPGRPEAIRLMIGIVTKRPQQTIPVTPMTTPITDRNTPAGPYIGLIQGAQNQGLPFGQIKRASQKSPKAGKKT